MSFQYIKPTQEQTEQMQVFRDKFEELAEEITQISTGSKGFSKCWAKLEEASFWLNKAITKND